MPPVAKQVVPSEETISKWIIYPKDFDKETGRLELKSVLQFPDCRPESVNWNSLFKNPCRIHDLGEEKVKKNNLDAQQRKEPPKETKIYKGYINAVVGIIAALDVSGITFKVIYEPTEDNLAHSEIKIVWNGTICKKGAKLPKQILNDARDRVRECFNTNIQTRRN